MSETKKARIFQDRGFFASIRFDQPGCVLAGSLHAPWPTPAICSAQSAASEVMSFTLKTLLLLFLF